MFYPCFSAGQRTARSFQACRLPLLMLLLWGAASLAHAHKDAYKDARKDTHHPAHAHQHGTAKLDVAVESGQITLHLDTPLANLVGFERAPRTEAERKRVADALDKLRSPALFAIDPAAECKLTQVELTAPVLQLGKAPASTQGDEHADLDGDYTFSCAKATQAAWIDVGLFGFAQMQKLQVQLATPAGQFRRDLTRQTPRLSLKK